MREWGREGLRGVPRGLPRELGGVEPALWGLRRLRRGNRPRRESLGRAQETRECLGVKIHHPFQGAAPSNEPGLRPPNPGAPSFGLSPASPTPSPPGLPLACRRENRESGLRRARHPLGMLGRRDRLAAGRARPSSQGGGGACSDGGRARAGTPEGAVGAARFGGSPERPPTPSLPASGGGASRGGGEVRRRESDLRAAAAP